jgi:HK97 family phage major capsid protein
MPTEKEIQEKFDEAANTIKQQQNEMDRQKEINGELEGKLQKMHADIADNLKEVETMKATTKALDEQNKRIEELICNHGAKAVNDFTQKRQKALDNFTMYLRKGVELTTETNEFMADVMMSKKFYGLEEKKRAALREEFAKDVDPKEKGYWLASEMKDLQVQVDPDGGYFVKPEQLAERVTREFETSPVRQFATVINTANESVEHFITDEAAPSGGWVGEKEARPKTGTPQVGVLRIHTHEQYAMPAATQKMLDDAGFDIAAWLQGEVNDQFIRDENTAFVIGDGSQKPKGFLDYDDWSAPGVYTRKAIERIPTLNSLEIVGDDVKILKRKVLRFYQPNSAFFMNQETFGLVERLKDNEDRYLLDTNSLKVGDTEILLGKRVIMMDDIAAFDGTGGVANTKVIVYGDLRKCYEVVDRIGIRVLRDPYTDKPLILFYTTKRVGGAVKNYQGLKILTLKA